MSTCHDATSFPNSHPYPYARIGANYPSLGRHIARRLLEIGVTDVFSVPGDFNLVLLDHLLANDNGEEVEARLNLIGCCNELKRRDYLLDKRKCLVDLFALVKWGCYYTPPFYQEQMTCFQFHISHLFSS